MSETGAKRQTAAERREAVLKAAIQEFATYGYHGGSTERIARDAGISQPYVLRLFGTKRALFILALEQVCDEIVAEWRRALKEDQFACEDAGEAASNIAALQGSYYRFVKDVVGLRLVLQASAAAEDPEIRTHLKRRMGSMFDWVRTATGASYEEVREFWAQGMMLTIAASIGAVDDMAEGEWARAMLMMPNQAPG